MCKQGGCPRILQSNASNITPLNQKYKIFRQGCTRVGGARTPSGYASRGERWTATRAPRRHNGEARAIPLKPDELRRVYPAEGLPFEATDRLTPLDEVVAQVPAVHAIAFRPGDEKHLLSEGESLTPQRSARCYRRVLAW